MSRPNTVSLKIHLQGRGHGARKAAIEGELPSTDPHPAGRVPRIARLMALAIRFEGLIQSGEVTDYAELARLGHVTRSRITQIMNLRLLAPDIQEQLLFLPRVERGRAPIKLSDLQAISGMHNWRDQRRMWSIAFHR